MNETAPNAGYDVMPYQVELHAITMLSSILKLDIMFKDIKKYSTKLINIGVFDEISSLNAIRQKYVNVVNYLLLIVGVGVGMLDMYEGETFKVLLGLFVSVIYSTSLYLSYKKKMEASIILTCTVLNVSLFSACYFQFMEPFEVMPPIIYSISGTLFLISSNRVRLLYITICSVILTIIVLKYNFQLDKTIPTLIQVIISIFVHNLFMIFVESQDRKLNTTVSKLESSHFDIERLNEFLTNKNKEITTYSHAMSHDLKAPLKNIYSFVGLIKKTEKFEKPTTHKFFSIIEDSVVSMNTLIDDLLNYSKISNESIEVEKVAIEDIINQVIANFKYDLEYKNVTIDVDKLPVINGNKQLLKRLFQNLIANSIKYQPKNEVGHVPMVKISTNSDNQYDYINITDNGIGIDKDYLRNLFEPFKRFHSSSEYSGTGLGMSICKKIMEKHQGAIELIETSKNGTTFQLSFKKNL